MNKYLLIIGIVFLTANVAAQAKKDTTVLKRIAPATKKDSVRSHKKTPSAKKDTSVKRVPVRMKKDSTQARGNVLFPVIDSGSTVNISPLKSMSFTQYRAFVNGEDQSNMAAVADVNHYPDPQKTITWKKELVLTNAQLTQINTINTELVRKMKEMGQNIIKNEKTLEELFRTKKVIDGTLIFYTNRFGLYQGEQKNAVLQAYVKVYAILTPVQRKKYEQLQKIEH